VDSSVTAKLTWLAFGGKALILYVSGLDRKGDTERAENLAKKMGMPLTIADGQEIFVKAVQGLPDPSDPQAKRRAIGNAYISIFDSEVRKRGWDPESTCMVQGTLYTDRIESGEGIGKKADNIKAHHNVDAKAVQEKAGKGLVIEPNKWKYKDGSRRRAAALGLPEEIINAQPFPGPGLAVRHVGGVFVPEGIEGMRREVNAISSRYGMEGCVFPIRTVGVLGDERAYLNMAVLWGSSDFQSRRKASMEIVKKVRGIGRVAFSFHAPDQEELLKIRPLPFDMQSLALLREIDSHVNSAVERQGIAGISQMPVILFPGPGRPWVGIRPVETVDYMTAAPVGFPDEFARQLSEGLIEKFSVGGVVFDDTDKPPGTIEWE
jgi:GMP synthase (glutamine-hydrolysing)